MNPLWIVECNITSAISSEHPLRLAPEDYLLDLLDVTMKALSFTSFTLLCGSLSLGVILEIQVVVHYGLLLVALTSVVSALHELLYQPLNDGVDFGVVQTLDLLRGEQIRALHLLQGSNYLF